MSILCSICKVSKDITEFYAEKRGKSGHAPHCKNCEGIRKLNYARTKVGLITKIYSKQRQSSKLRKHPMPTYSKPWLVDYLLNNLEFNKLYDNWVASNYLSDLVPSIDRIDCSIPYVSDNIQILTWVENNLKGIQERKLKD